MRMEIDIPEGLHPDTAQLVKEFAEAMATKLLKSQIKRGYSTEWMEPDRVRGLKIDFIEHVKKGDPLDCANYCAFLWKHGASLDDAQRAYDAHQNYLLRGMR